VYTNYGFGTSGCLPGGEWVVAYFRSGDYVDVPSQRPKLVVSYH
jgi:hypothetical protein